MKDLSKKVLTEYREETQSHRNWNKFREEIDRLKDFVHDFSAEQVSEQHLKNKRGLSEEEITKLRVNFEAEIWSELVPLVWKEVREE